MKKESKVLSKVMAAGLITLLVIISLITTCSCTPKKIVTHEGVIIEELSVKSIKSRQGNEMHMNRYVVKEYYPEHNPEKQLIERLGEDIYNVGDTLRWHTREDVR